MMDIHFIYNCFHNVYCCHCEGINKIQNFSSEFRILKIVINEFLKNLFIHHCPIRLQISDSWWSWQKIVIDTQFIGSKKKNMAIIGIENAIHNGKQILPGSVLITICTFAITIIDSELLFKFIKEKYAILLNSCKKICKSRIRSITNDDWKPQSVCYKFSGYCIQLFYHTAFYQYFYILSIDIAQLIFLPTQNWLR